MNTKPLVNNIPKSILVNFDIKSVGLNDTNRSKFMELCNYCSCIGANPYSVACSLTYIYSNLLNLKPKLTIKKAVNEFKISIMSVYRFKKSVCNQLML